MENTNSANHQLVYSHLVNAILEKKFNRGDWLPSENELCEKFNISRPTVRIALSRLESEGYIKKSQGKGSKVVYFRKGLGILSLSGTTLGIDPQFELTTKILSKPVLIDWPENFYFNIQPFKDKNIKCIHLKRERSLLEKSIICEDTYLPNCYIDGILDIDFENQSLFKTLSLQYAIQVKGGIQRFKAQFANTMDVELLKMELNTPILYIEREIKTNLSDFTFYSILKCNSENYFLEGSF